MSISSIEWTESTWNPLTGCNKVSPGCKHCYAERMAKRLQAMGLEKYRIWMGVSVENSDYAYRAILLSQTHAKIRFLSCEPLLGAIPNLPLTGIHWVIVGGESGPKARPMAREWATDIRDQCQRAGVLFFFKQWGGVQKKKAGRTLDGRTWDEMPASGLQTRTNMLK